MEAFIPSFFTEKKVNTDEGSRRVEIPMTLEEFKDLNHLLFVENQQEKMFERHTSQSVTYYNDFPLSVDKAYVYYVTPDSVYSEAADWEDYGKDRLCYQILGTSDPENSYMHYIADLTEDWKSNMWRYVPTDESKWMDYERDQFIGAYKEDGKIHLLTRYNEDLSREYAEETVGVKYEGETYITESIFDAKNYDYLEMIVTKELNDNSEVVCRIVFEYDTPEPAACRTLRCAFETAAANMVNVTFVVDPGTKNEISKKFMVPANTNVSYNIDDLENVEVFTDRKCETPVTEKWDKMSDITMYFKHVDTDNKAE